MFDSETATGVDSRRGRLRLKPVAGAPCAARRLVREVGAGLSEGLIERAALAAGELVRTSIVQARTTMDLSVVVRPDGVHLVLEDGGSRRPPRTHGAFDRCAHTLEVVAHDWGAVVSASGRQLWVDVLDADARDSAGTNVPTSRDLRICSSSA